MSIFATLLTIFTANIYERFRSLSQSLSVNRPLMNFEKFYTGLLQLCFDQKGKMGRDTILQRTGTEIICFNNIRNLSTWIMKYFFLTFHCFLLFSSLKISEIDTTSTQTSFYDNFITSPLRQIIVLKTAFHKKYVTLWINMHSCLSRHAWLHEKWWTLNNIDNSTVSKESGRPPRSNSPIVTIVTYKILGFPFPNGGIFSVNDVKSR